MFLWSFCLLVDSISIGGAKNFSFCHYKELFNLFYHLTLLTLNINGFILTFNILK